MRTRTVSLGVAALMLLAAPVTPAWGEVSDTVTEETRHPSGIALLPPEAEPTELPEPMAQTLHDAWVLTEEHPNLIGYPWPDEVNGEVVVHTVGVEGMAVGAEFADSGVPQVPIHLRRAVRPFSDLERIKDEVIGLTNADIPGADAIFEAYPDGSRDRVVVTVETITDELMYGLVARYGTEAVAVRHNPDRPYTEPRGRNDDVSPFWGGANIVTPTSGNCTSGFPWIAGSTYYMVTAGHCAPQGGSLGTPAVAYMGSVTSGSRENWSPIVGTVYLSGQYVYRGDLALIQIASGKTSGTRIYRGGPGSSTNAPVKQMWPRRAAGGDRYCTGGYVTGELCGWQVYQVRINHRYSSGTVVRNAIRGSKFGSCTRKGDSGGPVYTIRSDGGIAAKGITSGGGGGGGDSYGGTFDPCFDVFTDIWDAYYGFPGWLNTA